MRELPKEPIRILHIVGIMNRGGIETFLMNVYRKIDRTKVQFDFLTTREDSGIFDEEIFSLGGKVFSTPHVKKVGLFRHRTNIFDFFRSHKYKIVHCHMNTWSGLYLSIAKKCNIPIRIAHSHTAQQGYKPRNLAGYSELLFKNVMKCNIPRASTHLFACSSEAGKWLYGENISNRNVEIIKNGVDTKTLRYDKQISLKIRNELGFNKDTLVIGHVGSMTQPKNHMFIIDIFKALNKLVPNSRLVLVGDGPLREIVERYTNEKKIRHRVDFLGTRSDVHNLLKAFDAFIMPSLFEGFPVAGIEAQASALPCLFSNRITSEIDMDLGLAEFISLEQSPDYWAEVLKNKISGDRNISINKIIEDGYDSQTTVDWLQNFYTSLFVKD